MVKHALAIETVWSLMASNASFIMCHEIPDVPGADVEAVSMRSRASSLAVKGSKGRVGVGGGSSCCTTLTSPVSCTKKRSAKILAIDSGSKVRELLVSRKAAISDDRRPCLHFATSQILPFVTILSAHSLFVRLVTHVSSFRSAVVSSWEA